MASTVQPQPVTHRVVTSPRVRLARRFGRADTRAPHATQTAASDSVFVHDAMRYFRRTPQPPSSAARFAANAPVMPLTTSGTFHRETLLGTNVKIDSDAEIVQLLERARSWTATSQEHLLQNLLGIQGVSLEQIPGIERIQAGIAKTVSTFLQEHTVEEHNPFTGEDLGSSAVEALWRVARDFASHKANNLTTWLTEFATFAQQEWHLNYLNRKTPLSGEDIYRSWLAKARLPYLATCTAQEKIHLIRLYSGPIAELVKEITQNGRTIELTRDPSLPWQSGRARLTTDPALTPDAWLYFDVLPEVIPQFLRRLFSEVNPRDEEMKRKLAVEILFPMSDASVFLLEKLDRPERIVMRYRQKDRSEIEQVVRTMFERYHYALGSSVQNPRFTDAMERGVSGVDDPPLVTSGGKRIIFSHLMAKILELALADATLQHGRIDAENRDFIESMEETVHLWLARFRYDPNIPFRQLPNYMGQPRHFTFLADYWLPKFRDVSLRDAWQWLTKHYPKLVSA